MKKIIIFLLAFVFSSCTSLSTISTTTIPKDRSQVVSAEVSKLVFLMFSFNNDFVNELPEKLAAQCPNGKVSGLLTKHEVTAYILFFSHRVTATGNCIKG